MLTQRSDVSRLVQLSTRTCTRVWVAMCWQFRILCYYHLNYYGSSGKKNARMCFEDEVASLAWAFYNMEMLAFFLWKILLS